MHPTQGLFPDTRQSVSLQSAIMNIDIDRSMMKKDFFALILVSTLFCFSIAPAFAEKKAPAKATAPVKKMPFSSDAEDDEREPEISGTSSTDFHCEMGQKLTIYIKDADDRHIAIRWNKRIHRLTRVTTTTGVNRLENRKVGLVWIGIPAKSILLDSKKGRQLANECRNIESVMTGALAISQNPGR
jgi:hypothetical protein